MLGYMGPRWLLSICRYFLFFWDQTTILSFSFQKINLFGSLQGHGKSLSLMRGMFRSNGGCGYVKKPDFLITVDSHGKVFDPNANLPVKRTLKVVVCQTRSCMMFCWSSSQKHYHANAR